MAGRTLRRAGRAVTGTADFLTGGVVSTAVRSARRQIGLWLGAAVLALITYLQALAGTGWAVLWGFLLMAVVGQLIAHWSPRTAARAWGVVLRQPAATVPLGAVSIGLPLAHALIPAEALLSVPDIATAVLLPSTTNALLTTAAWAVTPAAVALTHTRTTAYRERERAKLVPILAQVFGVATSVFEATAAVTVNRKSGEVTISPFPPAGAPSLSGAAEQRLAALRPDLEFDPARCSADGGVVLRPASEETQQRRAAVAHSDGLVVAVEKPERPNPDRPGEQVWQLAPTVTASQAGALTAFARAQGLDLVDFRPLDRTAVAAQLSPRHRELRDRWAQLIGCAPHQLEISVQMGEDGLPEMLDFVRMPVQLDAERRVETALAAARALIPSAPERSHWTVEDRAAEGRMLLRRGVDPLGAVLPFTADVAVPVAPDDAWELGRDEHGQPVLVDLTSSAHMLIAGATRSGKSVATYGLLTHVVRMGAAARLLVADPNDTTIAPFEPLVSWSTSSTDPQPVTEMLRWVRAEMVRRQSVLRGLRRDKLDRFTPELPLLVVVIDEAANYLRATDRQAAEELQSELLAVVSQGAKYGVRLVLITQRPSSTILPTEVRSQLSARIAFRLEDKETAKMAFPDIEDPSTLLSFAPGVGLMKEVAGVPRRFRATYLADHWAVADQLRPLPRIDVTDLRVPVIPGATTPETVTLGEFAFTLDEEPEVPPLPTSPPEASPVFTLDSPIDAPPTPLAPAPPPLI